MAIEHRSSRRAFLGHSAAVTTLGSLPAALTAQESMRTRAIPSTGEALPVVGLGSPDIFVNVPPEGVDLPKQVIQAMIDLGGRIMDTPAFFRPIS